MKVRLKQEKSLQKIYNTEDRIDQSLIRRVILKEMKKARKRIWKLHQIAEMLSDKDPDGSLALLEIVRKK